MDPSCLQYVLTEEERLTFDRDGYFILPDVLPSDKVEALSEVTARIDARHRAENGVGPCERVNLLDFIGRDDLYLELLDWPKTFPKVWGILGWNIQLYHTHVAITPPGPPGEADSRKRLGWHQDTGRLNIDLETTPRPRISLKVAFFLTDTRDVGRANFYVVPGSHLENRMAFPSDGVSDPEKAIPVRAPAGSAVFFDRRIWHAASPNVSGVTRRVLFYGYSYRWLRPRDNMTVAHYLDRCDPIRRQLLGASTGGFGYTSPGDADVPLKVWIRERLGEAAVAP